MKISIRGKLVVIRFTVAICDDRSNYFNQLDKIELSVRCIHSSIQLLIGYCLGGTQRYLLEKSGPFVVLFIFSWVFIQHVWNVFIQLTTSVERTSLPTLCILFILVGKSYSLVYNKKLFRHGAFYIASSNEFYSCQARTRVPNLKLKFLINYYYKYWS